jgi:ankyrin repeat protein
MYAEQEMQQIKGRIAEVYARRERLKQALGCGELAPRTGLSQLDEIDRELSNLDSRYKSLWDAANPGVSLGRNLADWLVRQGFPANDIRARVENGMSPLMTASLKGERAVVEELLALGADPNHVNDDDHHALWFACVNGDADLVSLLIGHGANVDNQNVNGATCAIYAASTGKLEVLKRLVESGADLGRETSGGYNALESASTLPVLKYLRGLTAERRAMTAN